MNKIASLAVVSALAAGTAQAQSLSVAYRDNLLTIRCNNASLGQVFEQIESVTGLELFLEDAVKGVRLTADIDSEPLNYAVERLLAGAGVNYAMMYNRENWQQVDKLFIGEGGGPVASAQPAAAVGRATRRAQPIEDAYDPSEEFEDGFPEDEQDYLEEDYLEEDSDFDETDAFVDEPVEEAPGDSGYLPEPPSWQRSRFTPGPETSPFGTNQESGEDSGSTSRPRRPTRPPAYYPFTDQFGRPIPVPDDPNAQQDEDAPPEDQ